MKSRSAEIETKSSQGALADYYARRAPEYEQIYGRHERQDELRQLEDRIGTLFAGETVLEIACGTGYWTQFIARQASAILAVDCNEEVLAIASKKDYSGCRVEFRLADAYALAEVPPGWSAGFCGFWWSHVPLRRLGSFLSTFHSKLKQGARVVLVDNCHVEGSSTLISRRDDEGNAYQVRCLSDGSRYEVLKNFPSDERLRRELSGSCSEVEIRRLPHYWQAAYNLGKGLGQPAEA